MVLLTLNWDETCVPLFWERPTFDFNECGIYFQGHIGSSEMVILGTFIPWCLWWVFFPITYRIEYMCCMSSLLRRMDVLLVLAMRFAFENLQFCNPQTIAVIGWFWRPHGAKMHGQVLESFGRFDADSSGSISKEELGNVLKAARMIAGALRSFLYFDVPTDSLAQSIELMVKWQS